MDIEIASFINNLGQNTFIDTITRLISSVTFLTIIGIIAVTTVYFFDKKHRKKIIITIILALIIHLLITEVIIKHGLIYIFDLRIRPYLAHPDIIELIGSQKYTDSSFPSSHMASTSSIITILIYYYRKTLPFWIIFILTLGFARIHNGMHYPTDILAGITLGIIYGILSIYISKNKT